MAELNPLAFQQAQNGVLGTVQALQQNRLQQIAQQRAEDAYQQEQSANRLYAAAVGPDGTIDRSKLVTGFAQGGLGSKIPALQTQFAAQDKATREADRAKIQQAMDGVKLQGQLLGSAKDEASYQQALQLAQSAGVDISKLPGNYDPQFVQAATQRALSAAEQLDQMWKQRGYDQKETQFQQSQATTRRGQDIAAGTAAANRDVTMRGQDLTDARAREANATKAAADKAPTEFQSKAAMFGARAEEADRILGSLDYSPTALAAKQTASNVPLVGGALGAAANLVTSSSNQRAEQAQRDFINAVLRQESGAVIGQSEFDNARKQYFPQPGDSGEVIAQKAANRKTAIEGLKRGAGKAAYSAGGSAPKPSLADIFGN